MRICHFIVAILVTSAGCMSPTGGFQNLQSLTAPPYYTPYNTTEPTPAPKTAASAPRNSSAPVETKIAGTRTPTPTELATVMADVQQIGAQDPEAQQALLEDMKRTDPSLWPQLIRAFRSSMAYRQQSASRLAQAAPQQPVANTVFGAPPPSYMQQVGYSDTPASQPAIQPSARIVRPEAISQSQASSETTEGLLVPRSPAIDQTRSYPDTMLPAVRLISADNARAMPAMAGTATVADAPASAAPSDYHEPLSTAIRTLESKVSSSSGQQTSAADEARLRLLYLAAGRREDATNPLPGSSPAAHEFWNQEAAGLAALIDDQKIPDSQRRAVEAARHLSAAASELDQDAPLALAHLAFCTEVNSFGVYKKFPKYEFKKGEEVLLYAEVDNFISTTTDAGFHTSLHSGVQILNKHGDRVASQDFAVTEENCRNLRHDFFVRYFLNFPKNLASGDYTLQLTVEDTQGNKTAQANLPFSVTE